jgi:RHS repeat-associated protein
MLQPFGATHGDLQTLLKYPGQWTDVAWQDAASGINPYYNVHRWYEGGTGRYLQADPMGLDARRRAVLFGMPPTHPYAYTEGNPLTRLDPLARAWVDYLPEWFPWALQIRCFYYWRDCARQACDCANRLRGTVDEEELAELYAAAGGGYGGPLWEKCFTRIASCKTVVEVCPAAGWPDKPVGWP